MCFCTGDYCNSAYKLMGYKAGPVTKAPEDFFTRVFETGPRPAGAQIESGNLRPTSPTVRNQGNGGGSDQQGPSHGSSSKKQQDSSSKRKNNAPALGANFFKMIFEMIFMLFVGAFLNKF